LSSLPPPISPPPPRPADLRHRIFGHRLWIGLAVVVCAALVVHPRPIFGAYQRAGTAASIALIVLGLALRAWAGGCAGLHTRRATIEAPRLVTGGPFAHVRNPIYLASVILGFGMVALVGDPWLFAFYVGVFVLLYGAIVPAEEQFLRGKFTAEYERYCAHVPRAWPRLRAWRDATPAPFDPRAALGEARLALILAAIYILLRSAAAWRG
jgi:protein-S-isoprenylcysteine O-methyltransferase Ste14